MTRVFRLHSTLEVPLEELLDYLEGEPELPDNVADLDWDRTGDSFLLRAVPAGGDGSPTAQLQATVSEVQVTEEPERPTWGQTEAEPTSELVEMAEFDGDRDAVLQNSVLRYEMFLVLCEVAKLAERGELTAIVGVDGELRAVRYVDGERRPASVDVVEDPGAAGEGSVDWRSNQYITD